MIIPPSPIPTKVMEWSMEFWRKVLLGAERVQEDVARETKEATERRERGNSPDVW